MFLIGWLIPPVLVLGFAFYVFFFSDIGDNDRTKKTDGGACPSDGAKNSPKT